MNDDAPRNLIDQVLEEVTQPLRLAGVRYLLVGALGVMAHGAPRMTQDLDLRVELATRSKDELAKILSETGHPVKGPVRNEFGERFLIDHPDFLVEVYLAGAHPYIEQEFDRSVSIRFGETEHPVISKEDLILRKLYNMRVRRSAFDHQDVVALLQVHRDNLDLDYIRERARLFRLSGRFESLWGGLDEAGSGRRFPGRSDP